MRRKISGLELKLPATPWDDVSDRSVQQVQSVRGRVPVLNVGYVGSEELARSIAKLGDVRDIESYVYKEIIDSETRIISLLRPLKFPDSIRPLLSVLNVAKAGLVEITKVDAALGEILVSFGCAGITDGIVVINPEDGGWVDPDQVRVILSQAGLPWTVLEGNTDSHDIRETLLKFLSVERNSVSEALVIPIDQHFVVQGIGLVGIGYVQSGSVSKHDAIESHPAGDFGIVRSLQVMDDDVDTAVTGDRVGLALRNLKEESLHKGCMIVHQDSDTIESHESSRFRLIEAPFQKRELSLDDVVHAAVDLQFNVGRVREVEEDSVLIDWESPLLLRKRGTGPILIVHLDAVPMRIMGIASEMASV